MTVASAPTWVSIFADTPDEDVPAVRAFWSEVTGTVPADPVGDRDEFLPLRPAHGDRYLYLQRVESGEPAWHPDLHVPDLAAAALAAADLGAAVVRMSADLVTLTSPGGLPFCLVADERPGRSRPTASTWPGRHRSLLDQLCLDIPTARYDDECRFWSRLTGWTLHDGALPEFRRLDRPEHVAVRFLLQRLGNGDDRVMRAHADLASDDRSAETERHRSAGATTVRVAEHWTTLRAPGGHTYCITDRTP